jgi:hypothetical protein
MEINRQAIQTERETEMILKIECYRAEGKETFITEVRAVRYLGTVKTPIGETPKIIACGVAEYDYDFRGRMDCTSDITAPYYWREIVAETQAGSKIIAFDGDAYLMSDTGKTIERIKQ